MFRKLKAEEYGGRSGTWYRNDQGTEVGIIDRFTWGYNVGRRTSRISGEWGRDPDGTDVSLLYPPFTWSGGTPMGAEEIESMMAAIQEISLDGRPDGETHRLVIHRAE